MRQTLTLRMLSIEPSDSHFTPVTWVWSEFGAAVCSRRVRTAPLSSLTGLAFVLGPGCPAINRWAILYRPAGLNCARNG